jgi:hypothetical protein
MAAAASSTTPLIPPHVRLCGAARPVSGPSPAVRAVLVRSDVLPRQILGFLPPLEALRLRLVNKAWSKAFVRKDDALWWLDNAATAVARDAAAVAVIASAPSSPTAAAGSRGRHVALNTNDSVLIHASKRLVEEVLRLRSWGVSEMPPLPASTPTDVWLFWLYLRAVTREATRWRRTVRHLYSIDYPRRMAEFRHCCLRNMDIVFIELVWLFPAIALLLLPFQLQRVFDIDCVSHAYGWHQQHANVTDPLPFPSVLPDPLTLNTSSHHAAAPHPRVNWTFLNASLSDCGMDYTSLGFSMDPSGLPHDHVGASWSFAITFIVSAVVSLASTWLVKRLGGNYNPGDPPPTVPPVLQPALWRASPCSMAFCPGGDKFFEAMDVATLALGMWMFVPLILGWCAVFPDDTEPGITTSVALAVSVAMFGLAGLFWLRREHGHAWLFDTFATGDSMLRARAVQASRHVLSAMVILCLLGAQGIMVALNQALYWGCWWLGIPPAPPSDVPFRARDNPLPVDVMLLPGFGLFLFIQLRGYAWGCGPVRTTPYFRWWIVAVVVTGCLGVYSFASVQLNQSLGVAPWYNWCPVTPFMLVLVVVSFMFFFEGTDPYLLMPHEGHRLPRAPPAREAGATMREALSAVHRTLLEELELRRVAGPSRSTQVAPEPV